eukprot:m.81646 g.81646  ORF g.81646 m.81646 type:complete len:160 (-) comp14881_c2_seq15:211-690(-)
MTEPARQKTLTRDDDVDKAACPQCRTPYRIREAPLGTLVRLGDRLNHVLNRAAPLAGGMLVAGAAWAGLSLYGAVTIAHVLGPDGRSFLLAASPLKLFFIMPVIPLSLMLVRLRVAVRVRVRRGGGPGAHAHHAHAHGHTRELRSNSEGSVSGSSSSSR